MYTIFRNIHTFAEITLAQRTGFIHQKLSPNLFNGPFKKSIQDTTLFRQTTRRGFKSHHRRVSRPADVGIESEAMMTGPIPLRNLLKPFGFVIAFSSASIAGGAIWQYENMRAHAISMMRKHTSWLQTPTKKMGSWRQDINTWWNSLREGERVFIPICFANILVFAAWRVPRFQPVMLKYFCSNPAAKVICWPMVLSTFSHHSAFHLFANMFVLHSFSSGVIANLGKEQFMGMYLAGGVVSSFASYLYKAVTMKPGLSLGASGAIMAVLGYVCSEFPDTRLSIIFLPMYTFSAGMAIKVLMGVDLAGVLLGWKFFDHAAHLGGAMWGIFWCYFGNAYIWQKREPLLQFWHQFRGNATR